MNILTPKIPQEKKKFVILSQYLPVIYFLFGIITAMIVMVGLSLTKIVTVTPFWDDSSKEIQAKPSFYEFLQTLAKDKVRVITIENPNIVRQDNPESALFYKDAEKGDILYVVEAQNVFVLYRPSTQKIISITQYK
jgi:hypothetical protein